MSGKAKKLPSTPALRLLRAKGVDFEVHRYAYVERGGTAASSAALGIDAHRIIKTLIFEDSDGSPLVILMHGDCSVSAKDLARQIGTKAVRPCDPAVAQRHSGYQVGGTSPFGTRKAMPVYAEISIFELERIVINGGARGVLVEIDPQVLRDLLGVVEVSVTTARGS